MSRSEDERRRDAAERMRARMAEENRRRPIGGELKDESGNVIGRRGVRLDDRDVERAARAVATRTEREGAGAPPSNVSPSTGLKALQEQLSPERIRDGIEKGRR